MIVRPRPVGFGLIFALRGSVLPTIAPRLLIMLGISAGVVWLHHRAPGYFHDVSPAPFTLLGLALSIFLGFRNNACYERWWEGRRHWGELIAVSRSFLREIFTLLPEDAALRARCAGRVAAFAVALRGQLRGPPGAPPGAILQAQAAELAGLLRGGALSDILYSGFAGQLAAMTNVQTACERLRNTPAPFAYSLMLHRIAWLFCLLLPFGMVDNLGLATPLLTVILAYAFLGLDALGEELEDPFAPSLNGLPLDAMVRTIEIAVAEALGEVPPAALRPENFLLL